MLSIHVGDFAVYTNKKGTTIAVSYSDCAWNLQSTYTQVILNMMEFLVLKCTSTCTQVYMVYNSCNHLTLWRPAAFGDLQKKNA